MWFIIGLIVGGFISFFVGFILALAGQLQIERKAVKNGYVKLDGKLYLIDEMPKPKDYLNKEV